MRKRTFPTKAGDRVEFLVTGTGRTRDTQLSLLVWQGGAPGAVEIVLTPKEASRFKDLFDEVETAVWEAEMTCCAKHEIGEQCAACFRYEMPEGRGARCQHCSGTKRVSR